MAKHTRHDPELESYAIAHSLRAEGFDASEDGTGRGTPLVPVSFTGGASDILNLENCAHPITGRNGDAGMVAIPVAIQAGALRENPESGPDGVGVRTDGLAYTLEARAEVQAVAFDTTQITSAANYSNPKPGDACHPLAAGAHAPAVAFQSSQSGFREVGAHATLDANMGSRRHNGVMQGSAVRRLAPTECARLQGFPDDYLDISYRGKPAADGPKYKALGNSMAVPVMRWIGERIALVDALATARSEAA